MPPTREKMRPWLVRQINSNTVSGLNWLDEEKTMFSIPWIHAARQGWDMDRDACLFQKWAVHTGKYVVGQECSPKTWKANFRCALNSLSDVVEVKQRSVQRGHQAVRVYQLLPESHKPRVRRAIHCKTKSKRKLKMEEPDSDDEESSRSVSAPETLAQDSIVDSTTENTEERLQPELKMEMDVPDWSQTVEVEEDKYHFEVSPVHSPDSTDYNLNTFTIKICRPLERDAQWSSSEEKRFPVNDLSPSPGSLWSDTSSGEEIEERSLYATLSPCPAAPDLWSVSLPQILFDFPSDETPVL